jgi:sentrin-specific protease 7
VDIFENDLIFIPVNDSLHWSLIIVIKPRLIFEADKTCAEAAAEADLPCILTMDSLGYHDSKKFSRVVQQ